VIVLSAGRLWDAAKNVATLAEAARGARWPVFVAGSGKAPPSVVALGQLSRSDLTWWMKRSAIYALPARYEPFGLSALEAALHGAALVLGDIPSLREVWGEAAIYTPPNDSQALRRAIDRLADDDALRSDFGRRAAQRAARYTIEEQVRCYRIVYSRLINRAGSSHPGRVPRFPTLRGNEVQRS
jgi:glycosyltransferase involved in cell wall biosynthesis